MARPGFITHVLYRRTPTFSFNLEYYNAHHIPMCLRLWEPHGVVEHYVTQMTDPEAEFAYLITMVWKDEVRNARGDEVGMGVFGKGTNEC